MSSAAVLRQLPVPDTDGPPDRAPIPERSRRDHHRRHHSPAAVQGVLTLVVDDEPLDDFGPVPTSTHHLPDPQRWARQMVQVLVEVIAGHRPSSQLLRWTTPDVYEAVRTRRLPRPRPNSSPRRRPRVGTVRVCEPADGVAEVSAVVHGEQRAQALALRLEGVDGRWRVTALQAG